MKPIIISLLFTLFVAIPNCIAVKPPVKYGKVSEEELRMEYYALDSTASAVILCNFGQFSVADYHFRRTYRIKILNKEGLKWADYNFITDNETIVRGQTTNIGEDGKIEETRLKNESIFKTHLSGDLYRFSIAMPNVVVGSVIDIYIEHGGLPTEWRFQDQIPVKHSELIIEPSEYINYRKNQSGYYSLDIVEKNRWVALNVPAISKEPYIDNIENYLAKFDIDVLSINVPGILYKNYTTCWEDIGKLLDKSEYFGEALRGVGFHLNQAAREIGDSNLSDIEKIKAAHMYIQQAMDWNKNERIQTSHQNLNMAFNDGRGNSADVNLNLIRLLEKLDFDVKPVMISTLSNGRLSPYSPSLSKANYVLAQVEIGDQTILLDATDKYLPYTMLPKHCLNYNGQIISTTWSKPVDLTPQKGSLKSTMINLRLTDDLKLVGTYLCKRSDYAAYSFRKKYHRFSSEEELVDKIEDENPGLKITTAKFENIDDIYTDVRITYEVEIDNAVTAIDNEIYIDPLVFEKIKENLFINTERMFPIYFAYTSRNDVVISIEIPEAYKIVSIPAAIKQTTPSNDVTFLYQAAQVGNKVQVVNRLVIHKPLVLQTDYLYLREAYNNVIQKHSEPIIINTL